MRERREESKVILCLFHTCVYMYRERELSVAMQYIEGEGNFSFLLLCNGWLGKVENCHSLPGLSSFDFW